MERQIDWSLLRALLPKDLKALAFETSFVKRCRGFDEVDNLVHAMFLYATGKSSLSKVSSWSRREGLAKLSAPGLYYRIAHSEAFLQALLNHLLVSPAAPQEVPGWTMKVVDATYLAGPGSDRAHHRIHLTYAPELGKAVHIQLTDEHGAETLERHPLCSKDLVLADAGHSSGKQIAFLESIGCKFIIRMAGHMLKLRGPDGKRVRLKDMESHIPKDGKAVEIPLEVGLPDGRWIGIRVIGAAGKEDPIWLMTNLSGQEAQNSKVLGIYRSRWQIELLFKRYKSLLDIDELRSAKGPSARPFILLKLILALLIQKLESQAFSPLEEDSQRTMEGLFARDLGDLSSVARKA